MSDFRVTKHAVCVLSCGPSTRRASIKGLLLYSGCVEIDPAFKLDRGILGIRY